MTALASGPWSGVRRLLAVRLDNLGDLLMTTPALAALRESLPDARITLLASPAGCAALPHLPEVDAAIAFDAPWVAHRGLERQRTEPGVAELALLHRLAQQRFDAAVIFTTATQSPLPMALLASQAGIALRLAHCRENPYALLSDWVRDEDVVDAGMRHEVRRQLDLVGRIGARCADERLRFTLQPADQDRVAGRLHRAGIAPRHSYVLVHPGASAESRRWPAERFGSAAAQIAQRDGRRIVVCGSADEAELVERARAVAGPAAVSMCGQLSLGELAALIDGASLLLCNNSGPAHIAAAVGTPVVTLYALTNPQHRPWRVRSRVLSHDVPCRWCLKSRCPEQHQDCIARVTPEQAAEAAHALLQLPRPYPAADVAEAATATVRLTPEMSP